MDAVSYNAGLQAAIRLVDEMPLEKVDAETLVAGLEASMLRRGRKQDGIVVELVRACELLLKANEALMPGVRHIAVQDYALLNDAPLAARKALDRAKVKS